jgi:hypothetical protein
MSLSSSLASWQVWEKSYCSGQYLKTLSTKLTETLEQEYQNYLKSEPENRVSAVKVDDDLEVDFSAMTLTKTSNRKRKPKGLQRTHRGLQLIYKYNSIITAIFSLFGCLGNLTINFPFNWKCPTYRSITSYLLEYSHACSR